MKKIVANRSIYDDDDDTEAFIQFCRLKAEDEVLKYKTRYHKQQKSLINNQINMNDAAKDSHTKATKICSVQMDG